VGGSEDVTVVVPSRKVSPSGIQVRGDHVYWAVGGKLFYHDGAKTRALLSLPRPIDGFFVRGALSAWVASGDELIEVNSRNVKKRRFAELVEGEDKLGARLAFYWLQPNPNRADGQAMALFGFTDPQTYAFVPRKLFRATLDGSRVSLETGQPTSRLGSTWPRRVITCGSRRMYPQFAAGIGKILVELFGAQWSSATPYREYIPDERGSVTAARCHGEVVYVLTEDEYGRALIQRVPDRPL